MSERERTLVGAGSLADLGKSIFPSFTINVPLPARTAAPPAPSPVEVEVNSGSRQPAPRKG